MQLVRLAKHYLPDVQSDDDGVSGASGLRGSSFGSSNTGLQGISVPGQLAPLPRAWKQIQITSFDEQSQEWRL